ncbi:hypothetical protein JCM3263A_24400 [Thermobifida fusca]
MNTAVTTVRDRDLPFETDGVPFLVARQRLRPASRTNGTWLLRCLGSAGSRDRVAPYSQTVQVMASQRQSARSGAPVCE